MGVDRACVLRYFSQYKVEGVVSQTNDTCYIPRNWEIVAFSGDLTYLSFYLCVNKSKFWPESFRINRTFLAFLNLIFKSFIALVV